ncbi:MAG: DNA-directed RNA polymerase subunit A'' [Candidatus Aenigmatarchaeota archaeon]
MSKKLLEDYLDDFPANLKEEVERVITQRKLNEEQQIKLIEEVKREYYKNMFQPGEAIGILVAQSISEPATQMTMRTYHFAASAGIQVTLGLPRLIEIFDARKEPTTPMMTIYLKPKHNTKEAAEEFSKKIKEKKVKYFATEVTTDLTNKKIKINFGKITKEEMDEIVERLQKLLKGYQVKPHTNSITIEPKQDISIKELEKLKRKVLASYVSGVENVKNAVVVKEGNDWVVKTLGSNLEKIFQLEEVDFTRTYSNNFHEVEKILGIEAARTILIREINNTLKQQGLNVDERHITLVADIMCFTGEVRPVGRYGVAGTQSAVLSRAGFEETIKHLVRASVRNEVDEFEGIFDNVMINQQVPVGTGMFELIGKVGEE